MAGLRTAKPCGPVVQYFFGCQKSHKAHANQALGRYAVAKKKVPERRQAPIGPSSGFTLTLPHTGVQGSNDIGTQCLGVLILALRVKHFDSEFSRYRLQNIFDDDRLDDAVRMAPLSYLTISKSE
jgi:hypothetical protein